MYPPFYLNAGRLFWNTWFSLYNQNHRLSQWFALPLEGAIIGCVCKCIESPPSALLSQLPPLVAIFICFFTCKQVNVFTKMNLSCHTVFLSLIIHIFFCVFLNCINVISSIPKVLFLHLYYQICISIKNSERSFLSNIQLFLTHCIWVVYQSAYIWYRQHSAAIISIAFLSHHCLSIFPISAFIFPYSISLLCFGTNTTWYLHSQLVHTKRFT